MTKPVIVKRNTKGSALTFTELDDNFQNLDDATFTLKADTGGTDVVSDLNGTITLVAVDGITVNGDNTTKEVSLDASLVQDTSPQLGGDLDVNGYSIVSSSDGNIILQPDGSGAIILAHGDVFAGGGAVGVGNGSSWGVIAANGAYDLILLADPLNESGQAAVGIEANGDIRLAPGPQVGSSVRMTSNNAYVGNENDSNPFYLTTYGAKTFNLTTNSGTGGGKITVEAGTNAGVSLDTSGTGVILVQPAGTSLTTLRRSATSGTISAQVQAQRNRTNLTLSSMSGQGSGYAFGVRGTNGGAIHGRLASEYQTSGDHRFYFDISTDNFTTPLTIAALTRNRFEVGQNNTTNDFFISNKDKTKTLYIGNDQVSNPTVAGCIVISGTYDSNGLDTNDVYIKAQNYGEIELDCFFVRLSGTQAALVGNGSSLSFEDGGVTNVSSVNLHNAGAIELIPYDNVNIKTPSNTELVDVNSTRTKFSVQSHHKITTASIARGNTYTVPTGTVTLDLTITSGSGTTTIDITNITGQGVGIHFALLVYNNSGTNNIQVDLINSRINNNPIATKNNIATGGRHIYTVYVIGNYATAEVMDVA